MAADCKYEWCDGTQHGAEGGHHTGVIAAAVSTIGGGITNLECSVHDDEDDQDYLPPLFHFDIQWWEIEIDDVEQEIADMRNMVDQFADAMRKVKTEVEN